MSYGLRRQSQYAAWFGLVLGILIFGVPLVAGPQLAWHHLSNYTVGPIVVLVSTLTLFSPHRRTQGALAGGGIEFVLGAWVFFTAFFAPASATYMWSNAVLGAALVLVAAWSLAIGVRAEAHAR